MVGLYSVGMRVLPGKETGSGWTAQRSRAETVFEHHTFPGNSVQIGGFEKGMIHTAEGVPAMIVRKDKDYIGHPAPG